MPRFMFDNEGHRTHNPCLTCNDRRYVPLGKLREAWAVANEHGRQRREDWLAELDEEQESYLR